MRGATLRMLAARNNVRTVVKSKSMVTEEIDLTHTLEEKGVNVFETDLGEMIVQLRNEPPYHLMTPAMHLTRAEIADLFREKLGEWKATTHSILWPSRGARCEKPFSRRRWAFPARISWLPIRA